MKWKFMINRLKIKDTNKNTHLNYIFFPDSTYLYKNMYLFIFNIYDFCILLLILNCILWKKKTKKSHISHFFSGKNNENMKYTIIKIIYSYIRIKEKCMVKQQGWHQCIYIRHTNVSYNLMIRLYTIIQIGKYVKKKCLI